MKSCLSCLLAFLFAFVFALLFVPVMLVLMAAGSLCFVEFGSRNPDHPVVKAYKSVYYFFRPDEKAELDRQREEFRRMYPSCPFR